MPPRRRRKLAAGASMGALLADLDRDRKQREYDEAKAKADAREKASERSKRYVRIVNNYVKDGSATYEETMTALKAELAAETDSELKGILQDYISDVKLTKQSKDVNNLVDDYTYGRRDYQSFKSAMEKVDKSNALIAEAVSKNLQQARKTENVRQLTKWQADYKSGALPYDQYVRNLNALRSESDQKDPNDIAAITQHLTAAQQNEQQIQDNKVYVEWQTTGNAGAALQYFNSRLAQSKNVQDANTIEQYIKTINAAEKQRGSAAAAASDKVLDAVAEQSMKSYEEKTLKKELEAAKGDPQAIVAAYERFGQFIADRILPMGAPKGVEYRLRLETLAVEAQAAASDAILTNAMSEIDKWTKIAEDPKSDPQAVVNAWKKVAAEAAKTETSPWLIAGQDKLVAARDRAAQRLMEYAREAQAKREATEAKVKSEVGRLYDGAQNVAQFDKDGRPLIPAARGLKSAMDAGIKFDGTAEDKNRFAQWLINNPENVSALERAAGVNVSTVVKSAPGAGTTETSTTFGDTGEGPPKTGSLTDLLTENKNSRKAADAAFEAANNAFFPGLDKGRFNLKAPDVQSEEAMIAASTPQAGKETSTPAMDRIRQMNADLYPSGPPNPIGTGHPFDRELNDAMAAQGLTEETWGAGARSTAGRLGDIAGRVGGAIGGLALDVLTGPGRNASAPPQRAAWWSTPQQMPVVEYSEVANYLLSRLQEARWANQQMPTATFQTPQMPPSQFDYNEGDPPSQFDYSQGDPTAEAPPVATKEEYAGGSQGRLS